MNTTTPMNDTMTQNSTTGSNLLSDLLETIQADVKFFKEMEDGSFTLEEKSVSEILTILRKRKQVF